MSCSLIVYTGNEHVFTFTVVVYRITWQKCTLGQYGKIEMEVNVHDAEGNACKLVTSMPFGHKYILFFQLATSQNCPFNVI